MLTCIVRCTSILAVGKTLPFGELSYDVLFTPDFVLRCTVAAGGFRRLDGCSRLSVHAVPSYRFRLSSPYLSLLQSLAACVGVIVVVPGIWNRRICIFASEHRKRTSLSWPVRLPYVLKAWRASPWSHGLFAGYNSTRPENG
jgi:hypothetical protein